MLATNCNPLYSYQTKENHTSCIKGPYIYIAKDANKSPVCCSMAREDYLSNVKQFNNTNACQNVLVTFRVL